MKTTQRGATKAQLEYRAKFTARKGEPYGGLIEVNAEGQRITLYRGPRQACRYYDTRTGAQVGPEQRNVVPAVVWAMVNGFHAERAP